MTEARDRFVEGRRILTDFKLDLEFGIDKNEPNLNLYKAKFSSIKITEDGHLLIYVNKCFRYVNHLENTFWAKCKYFDEMFFLIPKHNECPFNLSKKLFEKDEILIRLEHDSKSKRKLVSEIIKLEGI